jgi:hypothetical protein
MQRFQSAPHDVDPREREGLSNFTHIKHPPSNYTCANPPLPERHGYPWVPIDQGISRPQQADPTYQKTRRSNKRTQGHKGTWCTQDKTVRFG